MVEHTRIGPRLFNSNFFNIKAQIKREELESSIITQDFYTGSWKYELHPVFQANQA